MSSSLVLLVAAIIGAIAGTFLSYLVLCVMQAILSAFFILKGVSFFIGGFPDVKQVARTLFTESQPEDQFNPDTASWVYMSVFVLLCLVFLKGRLVSTKKKAI